MARGVFFEFRRGTAAQWTSANPVLGSGEPGVETDTGMFKIGNGSTAWTSLGYAALTTAAGDTRYVLASSKGQASGVATLDSGGKIPSGQLPALRIGKATAVASQAAMLALATDDDLQLALRSDNSTTYVLNGGADPSALANWLALPQASVSTAGLEQTANKDVANGYAGLDGSGLLKVGEFPVLDGGTP